MRKSYSRNNIICHKFTKRCHPQYNALSHLCTSVYASSNPGRPPQIPYPGVPLGRIPMPLSALQLAEI